MTSPKSRGRNKFLTCFRPVTGDGIAGDHVQTNTTVGREPKESGVNSNVAGNDKPHRRFSRLLKDILFYKSLIRKIRNKKCAKKLFRPITNLYSKRENIYKPVDENTRFKEFSEMDHTRTNNSRFSSTNASTSLCSTCPSSIYSNSRSTSQRRGPLLINSRELKQKSAKKFSLNIGFCLVILCLFVLIMWGRTCAIFCTSSCLYFAPRRFSGAGSPLKVVDSLVNLVDSGG